MALPASVQRQLDQADLIAAQLNADAAPDAVVEAPAEPVEYAPAQEAVTTAPQVVARQAEPDDDPKWRQRYLSLQGSLQNTIANSVNARTAQLQAELENLRARLDQSPQQSAPSAPVSSVSEQDVQAFGADQIDLCRRVASDVCQQIAVPYIEQRLQEIVQSLRGVAAQVDQVHGTQVKSDQERFEDALTATVPNWRQLDTLPEFHAWLEEAHPEMGVPRRVGFVAAVRDRDAVRAGRQFQLFDTQVMHAPAPVDPRQVALAQQVAPARNAASQPHAAPVVRMWTPEQITAFYSDVRKGVFRGREAEQLALESDISAATVEGRIR